MINIESFLNVTDNSGAKIVKCIKVYGFGRYIVGYHGDVILVSVQTHVTADKQRNKINKKKKVLKGNIYKAIIVRVKKSFKRNTGETLAFGDNAVVLLKNPDSLMCTRVFGPVAREIRRKFMRIVSLSSGVF
jgi:large subunit ribosomal protein L14